MNPVFRFGHITKHYRRQVALDDVTFTGEAGQVIALLGENGAGKSTALKILLGLVEPNSGEAEVLEMDSRRQGLEIRRRVGYVAERPTLYEWMTVAEIGWFAAGFYSPGYVAKYAGLVERFELPEGRKIKHLSKGMRAKVALSLAMAHEPELLVLDEPTSGLDSLVRREFLESMVDIAAAGRTVLLSSHQIGEVERVADTVAILRHGKLVLAERLDELKERVRELTITLRNGAPWSPDALPALVLRRERAERQWRLLVRDLDESRLDAFRREPAVAAVEVRRPSLEDIFVGYMRQE